MVAHLEALQFELEELKKEIHALREVNEKYSDNSLYFNGSKKLVTWGGGTLVTALGGTLLTFWLGFYPSIAQQAWVKEEINASFARTQVELSSAVKNAPITREAELRISQLEHTMVNLKEGVSKVTESTQRMEAKLDVLLPYAGLIKKN